MQDTKSRKIKPSVLLYEVRKSISESLNRPFTERVDHQIFRPDQKILALWAADCADHVLAYFECKHQNDNRPRIAIGECRNWATTGVFRMSVIRKASLDAHAAAKAAEEDDAKFAAHAAGQAVGTAHVVTHSFGASLYGIRAAAAHSGNVEDGLISERSWQLNLLRKYAKIA